MSNATQSRSSRARIQFWFGLIAKPVQLLLDSETPEVLFSKTSMFILHTRVESDELYVSLLLNIGGLSLKLPS